LFHIRDVLRLACVINVSSLDLRQATERCVNPHFFFTGIVSEHYEDNIFAMIVAKKRVLGVMKTVCVVSVKINLLCNLRFSLYYSC
jgi:hypothetical protein